MVAKMIRGDTEMEYNAYKTTAKDNRRNSNICGWINDVPGFTFPAFKLRHVNFRTMSDPEEYQRPDKKERFVYRRRVPNADTDIERTDGLMGMKVRRESSQRQGNEREKFHEKSPLSRAKCAARRRN